MQQQARQIDRRGLFFRLFGLAIEERGAKLNNGRFQPGDLSPEFLNGCIKLAGDMLTLSDEPWDG